MPALTAEQDAPFTARMWIYCEQWLLTAKKKLVIVRQLTWRMLGISALLAPQAMFHASAAVGAKRCH